ncbi:MAG TPA: acetate/propionate family kinase [Candidatus Binataceae bacterium]|nr:acetate/propionate family kinase [Candidatus Binataceae bacterium]
MQVLVFNCGSSSLKFDLIDLDPSGRRGRTLGRGTFEEIGHGGRSEFIDGGGVRHEQSGTAKDHPAAALEAITWLETITADAPLKAGAIVHRIVHGGPDLTTPVIADAKVIGALEAASIFAPLHNPLSVATLRAVGRRLPEPPSVIVADTFFHQTMPDQAREYALPRTLAGRYQLRRYGFHGIAHAWMMERYAALKSAAPAAVNLITLQLGAGCSVCAIRAGRSVDTSMGLTPLEGLMMATRSGDLDPAIATFLIEHAGVSASKVEEILNHESGLLGVSGVSGDLRTVEAAAKSGNRDAALALRMFCYRVRKYIGAYLAALGDADALVFGGGIGEHSASVRAEICAELKPLGVELDPERNAQTHGREGLISAGGSRLEVFVIPVDEELYMARVADRLVGALRKSS